MSTPSLPPSDRVSRHMADLRAAVESVKASLTKDSWTPATGLGLPAAAVERERPMSAPLERSCPVGWDPRPIRRWRGRARGRWPRSSPTKIEIPGSAQNFTAGVWCVDHVHPPWPLALSDESLLIYAWTDPRIGRTVAVMLRPYHSRAGGRAFYEVEVLNCWTHTTEAGIRFDLPDPDMADCRETRRRALATAYRAVRALVRDARARRRRAKPTGPRAERTRKGHTPEQARWLRRQLEQLGTLKPDQARSPGQ